jgi:ligand-binding sensor domain-containing protein
MKYVLFLVSISIICLGKSQTFTNYTSNNGLIDNNVLCGTSEGNGITWFGTQNGISKFDGSNWTNFDTTTHPNLINNTITAIQTISNGDLWAGTDFGVCRYSNTTWTCFTETDGLGDNRVKYIKEASDGKIWVGEYDGLSIFDGNNWNTYNMTNGLPFGGIQHIDFDINNDAWLGSGFSGLIKFDGVNFTLFNGNQGLINNMVNGIAIDNSNTKWIGTSTGISVFNYTNSWTNNFTQMYLLPAPDTLNPVINLEFDSRNLLWAGIYVDYLLNGGVAMFNGYSWVDFNMSDGLIGPVITDLFIDEVDQVWITTSSGISKLSGVPANINHNKNEIPLVYPNPNNGEFNINFSDVLLTKLKVKNINGNILKEININEVLGKINLNLSNGVYFLEFTSSKKEVFVNKMIINK